eukprot:3855080-Amphidinium_carterae.1
MRKHSCPKQSSRDSETPDGSTNKESSQLPCSHRRCINYVPYLQHQLATTKLRSFFKRAAQSGPDD